jgi:hypothetical protein
MISTNDFITRDRRGDAAGYACYAAAGAVMMDRRHTRFRVEHDSRYGVHVQP